MGTTELLKQSRICYQVYSLNCNKIKLKWKINSKRRLKLLKYEYPFVTMILCNQNQYFVITIGYIFNPLTGCNTFKFSAYGKMCDHLKLSQKFSLQTNSSVRQLRQDLLTYIKNSQRQKTNLLSGTLKGAETLLEVYLCGINFNNENWNQF